MIWVALFAFVVAALGFVAAGYIIKSDRHNSVSRAFAALETFLALLCAGYGVLLLTVTW